MFRIAHFIMLFILCGLSQGDVLNAPDFAKLALDIDTKHKILIQEERVIREAQTKSQLAYLNNLEHYYIDQSTHRKLEWEHRIKAFYWQFGSSIVIFIVVIFIIATGLYFSYLQFKASKFGVENGTDHRTDIKVSKDGVEISSPVIGLLILFISLGFFYLYLKEVYPLHIIQDGDETQQEEHVTNDKD